MSELEKALVAAGRRAAAPAGRGEAAQGGQQQLALVVGASGTTTDTGARRPSIAQRAVMVVTAKRQASRRAAALDDDLGEAIGRPCHRDAPGTDVLAMPPPAARPAKKRRKLEVLDEDTYIDSLTQIITRDFFPELPQLRQQVEVLNALESNDTARLRELQAQFSQQRSVSRWTGGRPSSLRSVTPGGYSAVAGDTPRGSPIAGDDVDDPLSYRDNDGQLRGDERGEQAEGPGDAASSAATLSLDAFHRKYTSEDNESFEDILEKDEARRWDRTQWMHSVEQKYTHKQKLLKGGAADDFESRPASLESWDFKARNALIWAPKAVGRVEDVVQGPPKELVHRNTRLRSEPVDRHGGGGSAEGSGARGGAGGGGGYSLLVTPSPMPGVDDTPIMVRRRPRHPPASYPRSRSLSLSLSLWPPRMNGVHAWPRPRRLGCAVLCCAVLAAVLACK
jgi:hypothetical protein